ARLPAAVSPPRRHSLLLLHSRRRRSRHKSKDSVLLTNQTRPSCLSGRRGFLLRTVWIIAARPTCVTSRVHQERITARAENALKRFWSGATETKDICGLRILSETLG